MKEIDTYYRGRLINFKDRSNWVAVIGSREPSKAELLLAYQLAKKLVKEGKIVVSGLATGIDAAAHQGAIDGEGATIAIVNTPVFQPIFPEENRSLGEDILHNGGILYAFQDRAIPKRKGEKGLSHFAKRLIERDILLAHLCPVICTVKHDNEHIKGGTRWAFNYGGLLNRRMFRLDEKGKFVENPSYLPAKLYWEMELDINGYVQKIEKKSASLLNNS